MHPSGGAIIRLSTRMKSQSQTLVALFFVLFVTASSRGLQAPAASAPSAENAEQQQMQTIEDHWSEALVKRDQFALENILSPQFVDISAQGEITTRNQQVARLFIKEGNTLALTQKVVSTRIFGETAVVTGTYILRKKEAAGTSTDKGVFTHVFGRTRSGWLCLQSQRTAVVEQQSSGKKPGKKSSAEEPFHIPLFHKGAEPATSPSPAPPDASPTSAPTPTPPPTTD